MAPLMVAFDKTPENVPVAPPATLILLRGEAVSLMLLSKRSVCGTFSVPPSMVRSTPATNPLAAWVEFCPITALETTRFQLSALPVS